MGVGQAGRGVQASGLREQVCGVAVGQEGALGKGIVPPQVIRWWAMDQLRIRIHGDALLALLVFVGHFAVACLNAILLHGKGSIHLQNVYSNV